MNTNSKFNVGQEVEIIKDTSSHGFAIGSIVKIAGKSEKNYYAMRSGTHWYIAERDLKEVTRKFKVGDKVKVIANHSFHGFKNGETTTITELSCNGMYYTEGGWFVSDDDIESVPEQPKFKVGDKVKVIANKSYHGVEIGGIVEITEVRSYGYRITNGGITWSIGENEIELFTQTTPIKVGDKVVVNVFRGIYGHHFLVGDIGIVTNIGKFDIGVQVGDMNQTLAIEEVSLYVEPKVQPLTKFKKGDKVVPISKTVKGYSSLSECNMWKDAMEAKQDFLYVNGTMKLRSGQEAYVCCNELRDGVDGNFYNESDLALYVEPPKFKVGDKVTPISKTVGRGYANLDSCPKWRNAKEKKQNFLYVVGYEVLIGQDTIICNDMFNTANRGSYYLEADLTPYVEPTVEPVEIKVGDKVKVVANNCFHNFEMGEILEIKRVNKGGTYSIVDKGCYVLRDDIELVVTVKDSVKFDNSNSFVDFIMIGDVTVAVPKGCKVGLAYKDPSDKYSESKGKEVALGRLIK